MIVWGSISLAQSLMKDGLVDECRLVICPVLLGTGRPLFLDKVPPMEMKLLNATTTDRGAVSLKYMF
jgi:dihydrofolate reductase